MLLWRPFILLRYSFSIKAACIRAISSPSSMQSYTQTQFLLWCR